MNRSLARACCASLACALAALLAGAHPAAGQPAPKPSASPLPRNLIVQIMPTNIIPDDYAPIRTAPGDDKTVELRLRSLDGGRVLRIALPTADARALAKLPRGARLLGLTRSGEKVRLDYTTGKGRRASLSLAVDAARPVTETVEFRSR